MEFFLFLLHDACGLVKCVFRSDISILNKTCMNFSAAHVRLCTATFSSIFVTEDKIGAVKWLQKSPNLSVRSRA